MKKIKLTQGKCALVDDKDFEWLSKYKWYAHKSDKRVYARAMISGKQKYMHRLIMNTPKGLDTDHINNNQLDNRRDNLRVCSRTLNNLNKKDRGVGISWSKSKHKWRARVKLNGKENFLGYYNHFESAYLVVNAFRDEAMHVYLRDHEECQPKTEIFPGEGEVFGPAK